MHGAEFSVICLFKYPQWNVEMETEQKLLKNASGGTKTMLDWNQNQRRVLVNLDSVTPYFGTQEITN